MLYLASERLATDDRNACCRCVHRVSYPAGPDRGALSELCFRSKQVWGYDDDFMAFCREPLRVKPEEIAAGNVWVAAAADQSIVGVVALAPAGQPATLDL